MNTSTTLVNDPVEGNVSSRGKESRRPPALVLEDYNQPPPVKSDAPEGSALAKTKQGYSVLQRLHDLLPSSRTPTSASAGDEPPLSSAQQKQKQKQPRSASLPSVRWDRSPLGKKNAKQGPVKASTTDGAPLTAVSSTASNHYKVKGMKVRVITWNMHDSLPKGELEELLGKVPSYAPNPANPPGTFPVLPEEPDHPYHFVVVAGQECPSLSGLPMALGAGFKLKDREKEKEKEKDKDKDKDKEKDRGPSFDKDSERTSPPRAKVKEGNKSPDSQRNSETFLVKPTVTKKGNAPNLDDTPGTPALEPLQINIPPHGPPAGWSSVVEDWLCNGGIFELPKAPKTPKIVEVVGNVVTAAVPGTPRLALKRVPSLKEPKKGPYQLLVKERLMGIYLAIYVHRDLKPLIKGTSKSAVTAGLIGGRVGNKGGVGISVNVDGTTLLFLNAHLAAHEGRINHRLANLAKIKAELEVDDFLPKGDPRKSLEDLTDRFDFTFLCGDLNFRLDITRLHADWLISRKEYAQALAFDQLRKVMKDETPEFKGFNEADIDFPPTFKYDVLRTLKRQKRADNDDDDLDPEAEAMSISSVSTTYSRGTDTEVNATAQVSPIVTASPSKTSLSHVVSVQKAKQRLLSLKSPFHLGSPIKSGRKQTGTADGGFALPDIPATPSSTNITHFPPTPKPDAPLTAVPLTPGGNMSLPSLVPPPRIKVESMNSAAGSSLENLDVDRGVYDTSHKKRVPSWCDRILWKTTIEPSPSPEPSPVLQHHHMLSPPPKKVGGFRGLFRAKSAKIPRRPSTLVVPSAGDSSPEFLPPLKTAPPLSQTIFVPVPDEKGDANTSASVIQGKRRVSAASPPPSAPAERANKRVTAFGVLISPLSGGDSAPSRWRWPNFLSPGRGDSTDREMAIEEQVTPVVTPAIVRRRGEVDCLDYNTLDDRRMRRLEGRSDHRPVLGTFVMYI